MFIVILSRWFHPPWSHGTASYTRGLLEALIKLKAIDIAIISVQNKSFYDLGIIHGSDFNEFNKMIDKVNIKKYTSVEGAILTLMEMKTSKHLINNLNKLVRTREVPIIHTIDVTFPELIFISLIAKRSYILRHILTFPKGFRNIYLTRMKLSSLTSLNKRVVPVLSSKYLSQIYNFNGLIMPPAVNTTRFTMINKNIIFDDIKHIFKFSIPKYNQLPHWDSIITYIGHLTPSRFRYKETLIALKMLHNEYKINAGLLIIGKLISKKYAMEIINFARKIDISNKLLISLHHLNDEEKKLIFNLSSIFLYPAKLGIYHSPSIIDPPIIILEAMACGSIVVSSPIGSISKMIRNCENGFLLASLESREIVKKLVMALEKKQKIRQAAMDFIKRKYSINAVSRELKTLYGNLMKI